MKKVYICSPLGGDVAGNLEKVKLYVKYALMCDVAPVASHFYALSLNDDIPFERAIGTRAGIALLEMCDEVWAIGNNLTIGMAQEIAEAFKLGIPVIRIDEKQIYYKLELEVDNNEKIDKIGQSTQGLV